MAHYLRQTILLLFLLSFSSWSSAKSDERGAKIAKSCISRSAEITSGCIFDRLAPYRDMDWSDESKRSSYRGLLESIKKAVSQQRHSIAIQSNIAFITGVAQYFDDKTSASEASFRRVCTLLKNAARLPGIDKQMMETRCRVGKIYRSFARHDLESAERNIRETIPLLKSLTGSNETPMRQAFHAWESRNLMASALAIYGATVDQSGSEALSGVTSSFLFAGARGVLVSHWPVSSKAAEALTIDTFTAFEKVVDDNAFRRGIAEGLRNAMLKIIRSSSELSRAHPSYWAPFVLVAR